MSDPLSITAERACEIVRSERRKKGLPAVELLPFQYPLTREWIDSHLELREEYGQLVNKIATSLSTSRGRFILELIQNVEDCEFNHTDHPSIRFLISAQSVSVISNQDGFTERDVIQICSVRDSWKRGVRGYIGEKGLGFRSVFQVASRVDIQSNAFSFYFEYNGGELGEDKLGMVTPILGGDPTPLDQYPRTTMKLRIHERISYSAIYSDFIALPRTLLLFLGKVREISFQMYDPALEQDIIDTYRRVEKSNEITSIVKTQQSRTTRTAEWRYRVTRVHITGLENDFERPGINECESVLAFPISEDGCPMDQTGDDIYAFLPVCLVGFNFLVQADFILQANRQEIIVDSPWNMRIIDCIVDGFCETMIRFSRLDSLRFTWMRYLPIPETLGPNLSPLWRTFSRKMKENLSERLILYFHDPGNSYLEETLTSTSRVRLLADELLDEHKLPLFADRPTINRKYLSLRYEESDVEILRRVFDLRYIQDQDIYNRILQDLRSPNSRMKSSETSSIWHTRAASLISRICRTSPNWKNMIKSELNLIPLTDGSWVSPSTDNVCFFPASGPNPPLDLVNTVQSDAQSNEARRQLFYLLDIRDCHPASVIERLWRVYIARNRQETTLELSRMHLQYLYWHHQDYRDLESRQIWLYTSDLEKVYILNGVVYLPSNDDLGARELLRGVSDPHNPSMDVPRCHVNFLHDFYLEAFPENVRRHGLSWIQWLENVLKIRRVLRLTVDAGSLSWEFCHVLQYRPEKIVHLLRCNWRVYDRYLHWGSRNVKEIARASVASRDGSLVRLCRTYFPSRTLIQESDDLANPPSFPFLALPDNVEYDMYDDDWQFLQRFKVKFNVELDFFFDSLRHHSRYSYESLSGPVREGILKCYENISDLCNERNRDKIIRYFEQENIILHPDSFLSNSVAWVAPSACLWRAPENVLEKAVLTTTVVYRSNSKVRRLFHEFLGITDATWLDYLGLLHVIRDRPQTPNQIEQTTSLYKHLATSAMTEEERAELLSTFEAHSLIRVTDDPFWASPSRCLWSSPVPVPGKTILESLYGADLSSFFGGPLKISQAELGTLVDGLRALAESQPSIAAVKQMIFAINGMSPAASDLLPLHACEIFPVSNLEYGGQVVRFRRRTENFVVPDRIKLADHFRSSTDFLDFSFEEIRLLSPFLGSLDLSDKYLSRICKEETACSDAGTLDSSLTEDFRNRASYLVRCAVTTSSTLVNGDPAALFNRLSQVTIRTTDGLSTQFTIRYENNIVVGPISQPTGHVHIQSEGETWTIFVPLDSRKKEVCYKGNFPQSLAKLFGIEDIAMINSIHKILNSSLAVIDELLEQDGVVTVPGLETLPRTPVQDEQEDSDGHELVITPSESEASSGASLRAEVSPVAQSQNPQIGPLGPQIREVASEQNSYHILIDHVKRLANRTIFRSRHDMTEVGNNDFVSDFDHTEAFGNRSRGQLKHDMKIGAAGELFVYECLRRQNLPSFDWQCWTSSIKRYILTHPDYTGMEPWPGRHETSDLQYHDHEGLLTRWLIEADYLDGGIWHDATPEYLFEVKTTTGGFDDRFFMSGNQVRLMESLALQPENVSDKVYVILRVYNLGRENMNVRIYVDPQAHRGNDLEFAASTWTVTPVG